MTLPHRNTTRQLRLGDVLIGGGAPVVVQSMTNTDTRDASATLEQIGRLAAAGCEIVRLAVPDEKAAEALRTIAARSPVPLVADIHFDYRLALTAIESGIAAIRINPGNIGGMDRVALVAEAAKRHHTAIRVGVNAGSLDASLAEHPSAEALLLSAKKHVGMLESCDFHDMVISLKASDVLLTIEA